MPGDPGGPVATTRVHYQLRTRGYGSNPLASSLRKQGPIRRAERRWLWVPAFAGTTSGAVLATTRWLAMKHVRRQLTLRYPLRPASYTQDIDKASGSGRRHALVFYPTG